MRGDCRITILHNRQERIMLNRTHGTVKVFAGNSNRVLAEKIAEKLHMGLGQMDCGKFSDGEIMVNIGKRLRHLCYPVHFDARQRQSYGAAYHRRRFEESVCGQNYGGYAVFRICPSGQKSARPRSHIGEACCRAYRKSRRGQSPYDGSSRGTDSGFLQYSRG